MPRVTSTARRSITRASRPDAAPRKADVTRQSILDAAAAIFRTRGYSGARLRDIAERIGMKAGSLYYHFDSADTLLEAVMTLGVRRTHEAVLAELRRLPPAASHIDRLRAAVETHLVMILEQEDYTSATIKLLGQVPPAIRERQLARERSYGALWKQLLEAARDAGEIRGDVDLSVVRMALLGALNWVADWYHPGRTSPKKISREITTMVLEGILPARLPRRSSATSRVESRAS